MSTHPSFRRAGADDADDAASIRWALYQALAWNPERELPPAEATLAHPEAARYHHGWGRPGDLGEIASVGDAVVGVAYCRLFTEADHGHGYVDDRTPEVAVAVRDGWRGTGLGTRLLQDLAATARQHGFFRLSLSVDPDNPARRLYERLGYRTLSDDDSGVRMLVELEPRLFPALACVESQVTGDLAVVHTIVITGFDPVTQIFSGTTRRSRDVRPAVRRARPRTLTSRRSRGRAHPGNGRLTLRQIAAAIR